MQIKLFACTIFFIIYSMSCLSCQSIPGLCHTVLLSALWYTSRTAELDSDVRQDFPCHIDYVAWTQRVPAFESCPLSIIYAFCSQNKKSGKLQDLLGSFCAQGSLDPSWIFIFFIFHHLKVPLPKTYLPPVFQDSSHLFWESKLIWPIIGPSGLS